MTKVDFIFVILLYRNMQDIREYLTNLNSFDISKKVILVNNYFDKDTKDEADTIAFEFDCDIIHSENNGYGCGNNQGIRYAQENYRYEYIIVSNPDVLINKFDSDRLLSMSDCVVGPIIHTLSGKNQNPYWSEYNKFFERLLYVGMKKRISLYRYAAFAYFRLMRELSLKTQKSLFEAYALHGSFVMFHKNVIDRLKNVYDESIFMYSEEIDIAYRLKEMGIKSYVLRNVDVTHKEDGSVKLSTLNLNQMMKESYIKYYEKRNLK